MWEVLETMRVISQDGTIDVPYEMVVIQRFKEDIYFLNRNLTGVEDLVNDIGLAEYSTEEKAIKAMEMLRKVYENNVFYHHMSTTDTFKYTTCLMSNEEFNALTSEYFQFPQDDEIEV